MINQAYYGCGTRNRGGDAACNNRFTAQRQKLEERFLRDVRAELLSAERLQWAKSEIRKIVKNYESPRYGIEAELAEVEADLLHVVDAISRAGFSDALGKKLKTLEARKHELSTELNRVSTVVALPDSEEIVQGWTDLVNQLGELPKRIRPDELEAARAALRGTFGEVRVGRDGKAVAEIELGVTKTPSSATLVAGVGFEPTTFGL